MFRPSTTSAALVMLLVASACSPEPSVPLATEPPAPAAPPVVPLPSPPAFRVELTIDSGLNFPSVQRGLEVRLVPSSQTLAGRQVVLESTNPAVGATSFSSGPARASVSLRSAGTTELRARVDGIVSNTVVLTVVPLPPATAALVAEQFVLHAINDPGNPPDETWYMPQVRLREPTGRSTATLVGVMASMPTAPSIGMCTTSRTWAPGESANAFGLDRYFHEAEFSFGPFKAVPSSSPVTLTLVIRDQEGTLGTLYLSKTMGAQDTTTAPLSVMTSYLGC
jgi:hypothetical protein